MKPVLLAMASLFASWAGMVVLCFASPTQRHRMGLAEQGARQRRNCVMAAILLFFFSLLAAIAADGTAFGIVLWICQAGLAGLALVCMLPYSPAWVVHSSRAAALLATVFLVVGHAS